MIEPVGLAVRGLGFGILVGVALQALVTWTVRTLQGGVPARAPASLASGPALVLLWGTLAAIVAAGLGTGLRLAPLGNPWRQALLGLVAGLSSFVLSLVTIPVDRLLGRPGLLGLAVLAGWAALRTRRSPVR